MSQPESVVWKISENTFVGVSKYTLPEDNLTEYHSCPELGDTDWASVRHHSYSVYVEQASKSQMGHFDWMESLLELCSPAPDAALHHSGYAWSHDGPFIHMNLIFGGC